MDDKSKEMCENCQYKKSAEKGKSPDLGEMLKLAMMVSKMFSQNSPSVKPAPEAPQQVNPIQVSAQPAVMNVDSLAEDKKIRIIKSALPFLEPGHQQLMHLIAKCMEINNIMNSKFYRTRISTRTAVEQPVLGMFRAVKPHLDTGEQYTMDIACKALEMVEIMRTMDKIKPVKDDETSGGEPAVNRLPAN